MQKRYEATRPLEAIQIDHAMVDVIVIDDETGRELGRPWIALGFDPLTRVVAGFHLTMAPPTRLSTSLCLLHSICDKTRWLKDRGIRFEWPVAGLPDFVIADRNSFFGPRVFVRACKSVGIENVWNAPRDAKYGAHIESMIGTRLGHVPLLTDMASTNRDGCGRSQAARLTMAELECWIGAEITGNYHRRRHSALRRAPMSAWRALASEEDFRAPEDCVSFRLSFLPEEECDLHEDGVRLLGQTFWSRALADDFDADRKKLTVRYDPRDLSRIFVKRPSGRFVKAFNAVTKEMTPARFGAAEGRSSVFAALSRTDHYDELIVGAGSDWSSSARTEEEMRQTGGLALALTGEIQEWSSLPRGRDERRDASYQANRSCDRHCASSCPFQIIDR